MAVEQGQPREVNGQFGAVERFEDNDVDLIESGEVEQSDAEYNADSTFSFPPRARNARQHLDFWMNVKIPDAVLRQVQDVFQFRKAQRLTDYRLRDGKKEWLGLSGQQRYELGQKGVTTQEQYIQMRLPEVEAAQAPNWINNQDVRWVVRGYCAGNTCGRLSQQEQAIIARFKVPIGEGKMTVAEVLKNYDFRELGMEDSLKNPEEDVREAIERLRISMEERL